MVVELHLGVPEALLNGNKMLRRGVKGPRLSHLFHYLAIQERIRDTTATNVSRYVD